MVGTVNCTMIQLCIKLNGSVMLITISQCVCKSLIIPLRYLLIPTQYYLNIASLSQQKTSLAHTLCKQRRNHRYCPLNQVPVTPQLLTESHLCRSFGAFSN